MAKTVLITGANSGIGLEAARQLAGKGFQILAWCRNAEKGKAALEQINAVNAEPKHDLVLADLGDLEAVKAAAIDVRDRYPQLNVLLNNAGYYPKQVNFVEGIEQSLYACQLGHMLLSLTLMPSLEASGDGRIINVSSAAHNWGRFERLFNAPEKYSETQVYGDVKLANILLTKGLVKRAGSNVTSYSLHPGAVNTNFGENLSGFFKVLITIFKPLLITPEKGARTSTFLSSAPIGQLKRHNGEYYVKERPKKVAHRDVNEQNADALWDKSMEFLQPYLN
ncbi:MAG: SDR family NAD(P)-dependent oxidoreductase [Bacteroidota bacterium]